MPSSGAVIHMLCHGPNGPPGEPPRQIAVSRKQMLTAFLNSVWPIGRRVTNVPEIDYASGVKPADEASDPKP